MYELMQVAPNSYYVQSPSKVGVVRLDEGEVCLIDSGNDKEAGRRIRQLLDANGWRLRAIYVTHANADHIGGNRYLQAQTGCKIYAPGIDCAFTKAPVLEPAFLYGGFPPGDLRHKFLMAQASEAEPLTASCLPVGWESIPLPGHFFDMVGYRTPDDVVFLADCLSSKRTLDKYQITFVYDVAAYLQTLQRVQGMRAKLFVPAHAEATEDIAPLAQYNIDKVWDVAQTILSCCRGGASFDTLLQRIFIAYRLDMNFEQHALIGSTVRSYLAWLRDTGKLGYEFRENVMLWQPA